MGCGFLLLLMFLIIGPVILFSSLVSTGSLALITKASLTVMVSVSTDAEGFSTSQLSFYTSLNPVKSSKIDDYLQKLTFGYQSDLLIRNDSDRYLAFQESLNSAVFVSIITELSFSRTSTTKSSDTVLTMPSCASKPGFEHLCPSPTNNFPAMLEAAKALVDIPDTSVVGIPNVLCPVIQIDSSGNARDAGLGNMSLALASDGNQGYAALFNWTNSAPPYPQILSKNGVSDLRAIGSEAVFSFDMAPVLSTDGTGGALLSIGIVTIYITVVYAIGRFLRYVFDKESLRVIYLEIPRTDDFLDLATGASIARHYKDLPMEFKLYNCLIKVMRSPETLIALGGADVTGYGEGRHDDPPYPELLSVHDQERLLRRRRKKKTLAS
jgi:hypothetical protein